MKKMNKIKNKVNREIEQLKNKINFIYFLISFSSFIVFFCFKIIIYIKHFYSNFMYDYL